MTDLILAILHHVLVFSLVGLLAAEITTVRAGIGADALGRLGAMDVAYGVTAGLILIIGFARVFFGLKGAEYFLSNHFFWGKIGAFVVVGLLSVPPTVRIIGWRRRARADPAFAPSENEVMMVRRYMHGEAAFVLLILIFAAAMARGYGS